MSQMALHKTLRRPEHQPGRLQQSDLMHLLRQPGPEAESDTPLTKEAQGHIEEITQNVLKMSHRKRRTSTDNYVLVSPSHVPYSFYRDL